MLVERVKVMVTHLRGGQRGRGRLSGSLIQTLEDMKIIFKNNLNIAYFFGHFLYWCSSIIMSVVMLTSLRHVNSVIYILHGFLLHSFRCFKVILVLTKLQHKLLILDR